MHSMLKGGREKEERKEGREEGGKEGREEGRVVPWYKVS